MVSDDTFFLSQLDTAFEPSYAHLASATQSFLRGWYHDCQESVVADKSVTVEHAASFPIGEGSGQWLRDYQRTERTMGQVKRIRRSAATWREVFSRQGSSGVSVPEFCRREGINASVFRRWRSSLKGSGISHPAEAMPEHAARTPFIDLGDLRSGAPRVEVRLELGAGVALSIARG